MCAYELNKRVYVSTKIEGESLIYLYLKKRGYDLIIVSQFVNYYLHQGCSALNLKHKLYIYNL